MTGTVGRGLILETGLVPGNGFEGLQQGCGDIALSDRNFNRPAAISFVGFKTATGLRRYRSLGSKLHRAVLNIGCGTETALDLVYNIYTRNLMK